MSESRSHFDQALDARSRIGEAVDDAFHVLTALRAVLRVDVWAAVHGTKYPFHDLSITARNLAHTLDTINDRVREHSSTFDTELVAAIEDRRAEQKQAAAAAGKEATA